MQWSDVTATPSRKMLRQFAGLFLVVFVTLAAWRAYWTGVDTWTLTMAGGGLVVGLIGLAWPPAIRWLFTGWLIAAFPIGWTVSWLVLSLLFYGLFTPVSLVFKLMRRDALLIQRPKTSSYWLAKSPPAGSASYFRQS